MKNNIQIESRGRLGNQLFIYAFIRNIVKERNISGTIVVPPEDNRLKCFNLCNDIEFTSNLKLSVKNRIGLFIYSLLTRGGKSIKRISEIEQLNQHLFAKFGLHMSQESCLEPVYGMSNIIALGYFQAEKCFSSVTDEIRHEFEFKSDIKRKCEKLSKKIDDGESCCIHIRRGDYLESKIFGVCNDNYYKKAIREMRKFKPNVQFFVFSDDIDSVKLEFDSVLGNNATYIPSTYSDQESLYLGSQCKHFIISNSTFSWWMQYLSNSLDKIVIAPSRWYNDDRDCHLYQPCWKIIEP